MDVAHVTWCFVDRRRTLTLVGKVAGDPWWKEALHGSVSRRAQGANLVGAVVVTAYLSWFPPPGGRSSLPTHDLLVSLGVALGYMALAFAAGMRLGERFGQK